MHQLIWNVLVHQFHSKLISVLKCGLFIALGAKSLVQIKLLQLRWPSVSVCLCITIAPRCNILDNPGHIALNLVVSGAVYQKSPACLNTDGQCLWFSLYFWKNWKSCFTLLWFWKGWVTTCLHYLGHYIQMRWLSIKMHSFLFSAHDGCSSSDFF